MKKISPLLIGAALVAIAMATKIFEVTESIGAQIEPVMVIKDVSVTADVPVEGQGGVVDDVPLDTASGTNVVNEASPPADISVDQARHIEIDGTPPIEVIGVEEARKADELARKLKSVEEKEELLELEIKIKLAEIKDIRDELIVLRNEILAHQDESIKRLSVMYGSMKAKDAAAILNKMPIEMAIKIIDGMSVVQASTILGAVDPKLATNISAIIIKRSERLK